LRKKHFIIGLMTEECRPSKLMGSIFLIPWRFWNGR